MSFRQFTGLLLALFVVAWPGFAAQPELSAAPAKVYILPIREDIMPALVYVVRRGVKEAMDAKADALILDMETNGGRVDVTEEIIRILTKFEGLTVTYVNDRAFSAGAFIAVATQKIYMAPQSVIGAAAPVMLGPGGGGVAEMPQTMEAKMTSAIRALVRVQAEKNGHNIDVVEAMIDKTKELKIGDEVLNKEGNILTLTDRQAAKEYGEPPKPLLSSGTVSSMDALLERIGLASAQRVEIKPTGAERLGIWINAISPLLLIIGIIGLYIEFKTPGFGLPGIIGIAAFSVYFFGGYVAGLSGAGWIILFLLGLVLLGLEIFVWPGTFVAGIAGGLLILVALIMGTADIYPGSPGLPSLSDLRDPLQDLTIAVVLSFFLALVLARYLPRTSMFSQLVSQTASGVVSVSDIQQQQQRLGLSGVALSQLYPGGKARFGDEILDVITRGELVERGKPVKVIGHSGSNPVVEEVRLG